MMTIAIMTAVRELTRATAETDSQHSSATAGATEPRSITVSAS